MSKPGLMFDVRQAEQPRGFLKEVTLLVGVLRTAHEADGVGPIDGHLSGAGVRNEPWDALEPLARSAIGRQVIRIQLLSRNPRLVAGLPDLLRNARDRVVPGN